MEIYVISKKFPADERFSLTDQIRRSSRAVPAMVAEALKRRRYEAAFINKLNEAESEAAEVQVWLEFARDCGYLNPSDGDRLLTAYEAVLRTLAGMVAFSGKWCQPRRTGKA